MSDCVVPLHIRIQCRLVTFATKHALNSQLNQLLLGDLDADERGLLLAFPTQGSCLFHNRSSLLKNADT
jgi:hypothetical protein